MLGDWFESAGGRRRIDLHPAAQERLGPNGAANDVGIRERGLRSTAAVAGGSRVGTGRVWAHAKHTAFVHPYDRTTTGADGVDVQEGNADRQSVELKLVR